MNSFSTPSLHFAFFSNLIVFLSFLFFALAYFYSILLFQQVSHTYMTVEMYSAFPQYRLCNAEFNISS